MAERVRLLVCLVALVSLVTACSTDVSEPSPSEALVWQEANGVHGLAGRHTMAFGGDAAGGFAWTADGRLAVGVLMKDGGELVRWEPATGVLRRVPCAGCLGAAIVGDEVRTAADASVRRFALSDLSVRQPVDIASDGLVEVLAATVDLTIVKRGDTLLGVEDSGVVRWEYVAAGAVAPHFALAPTGEEMAFSEVVGSECRADHSEITVLELSTGRTRLIVNPSTELSKRDVVRDLWWNGWDLVVPVSIDGCGGHGEGEVRVWVKGSWDGGFGHGDDAAFRALPSGHVVRLSFTGVLTLDGKPVASGVTGLWSPPGREWVQLPGDVTPGRLGT